MDKHVIGVVGDADTAKARLQDAGIEVLEDHSNFASDDSSGSPDVAAEVEAESLEDAVDEVHQAILVDGDTEDDWLFRPVDPTRTEPA